MVAMQKMVAKGRCYALSVSESGLDDSWRSIRIPTPLSVKTTFYKEKIHCSPQEKTMALKWVEYNTYR